MRSAGSATITLRPRGPYRLAQSAWGDAGGTRSSSHGVLRVALRPGGAPAWAIVRQRHDGDLEARVFGPAPLDEAVAALRWSLAVDDDLEGFRRMAAGDGLLGPLVEARPGYRPVRLGTLAHAVLAAMAGQLVTSREAVQTERAIIRRASPVHGGLRLPPSAAEIGRLSVAGLRAAGLSSGRSATLARVVGSGDPERLRRVSSPALLSWARAERGLGPWSAGVIAIYGLGRHDLGMVGDLGLVRLLSVRLGRPASVAETATLLSRYGEWAGLASVHLLFHPDARERRRGPRAPMAYSRR